MTFSKVLKFGCLGVVGVFVLLLIVGLIGQAMMTPQEKAAQEAKRQAAAAKEEADEKAATAKLLSDQQQSADALQRRFTLLRRLLPAPNELAEHLGEPPALKDADHPPEVTYLPVDYAFLAQFSETGFAPIAAPDPHLWYRGDLLDAVQKALTSDVPPEKRNAELARVASALDAKGYLAVFFPLAQDWPELDADGKKFVSGYFQGWVVLVDLKRQALVGQTLFEARNSAKVKNRRLTVSGIPIGSGMGSAVASDFTDNFWSAANQAIAKIGVVK